MIALWTLLSLAAPPAVPPALAAPEVARYHVAVGRLDVGEISLASSGAPASAPGRAPIVHARGEGEGSIFGLGRQQGGVVTEFDPNILSSRRWTMTRVVSGRTTRDEIDQRSPGQVEFVRVRDDGAPERHTARIGGPLLDPVGLLLRLRASPPRRGAAPEVFLLLDGQALWRVTISPGVPARLAPHLPARSTIRLEGRAEPIRYDGESDGDRVARSFVLWLSADRNHLPLRLEMPLGISELVVSLVNVERSRPRTSPPTPEPPAEATPSGPGSAAPPPAPRLDAGPPPPPPAPEPDGG